MQVPDTYEVGLEFICNCFCKQDFAAARRAKEKNTFGRRHAKFLSMFHRMSDLGPQKPLVLLSVGGVARRRKQGEAEAGRGGGRERRRLTRVVAARVANQREEDEKTRYPSRAIFESRTESETKK
ncbi:uncharacterized protein DS421_8g231990 [Arachis hypogaea]|nr:uncharacterized protein DS421_8g231990 [Arachis hypogaea]